jgi:EpsI family protein
LLLLAFASYLTFYFRGPVPLRQNFSTFPAVIGNWAESGEAYQAPILRVEGADEELHRIYVGPEDHRLHLYVAYFERQQHEKEAVSHLMAPFHRNAQTLLLDEAHSGSTVGWRSNIDIHDPGEVFFWYDINGRVVSDPIAAKAATIKDALTRGRTNGALVLIHRQGNCPEGADQAMKDFILALLPLLRDYLP